MQHECALAAAGRHGSRGAADINVDAHLRFLLRRLAQGAARPKPAYEQRDPVDIGSGRIDKPKLDLLMSGD